MTPASSSRLTATVSSQSSVASSRMRACTGAQSARTSAEPAMPVDPPPVGQQVGGPDDHLARDAAEVGTLAAHQPLVDPDHLEAGLGQLGRRRLTTGAEPDHHHVARVRHGQKSSTRHQDQVGLHGRDDRGDRRPLGRRPEAEPGLGARPGPACRARCRARCRPAPVTRCRSVAP